MGTDAGNFGANAMNCTTLKSSVLDWIGQEIECRPSGDGCLSVALPILKPNGDAIEIGLEQIDNHTWKLSDLGETYAVLYLAGVDLYEEYVRAEEFRQIKLSHQVDDDEQELSVITHSGELVEGIFDFAHALQSMLALQFTLQSRQPRRDFASIVAKFLAEKQASFDIPNEYISGKGGKWKFNFVLNHIHEETLVKAITGTTKAQVMRLAEASIFEISDVQQVRSTSAIVIADDEGSRKALWEPRVRRLFDEYKIPMYPFEEDTTWVLED